MNKLLVLSVLIAVAAAATKEECEKAKLWAKNSCRGLSRDQKALKGKDNSKAANNQRCWQRTERANNFCARCPTRRQDCGVDNRMCGEWARLKCPENKERYEWFKGSQKVKPDPADPTIGEYSRRGKDVDVIVSGRCANDDEESGSPSFNDLGGHCKDPEHGNPGYMLKYCANTCCEICRSCPASDRLEQCVPDGYGQCAQWAAAGECDANTVWMHQHCMGSCCPKCSQGCPTNPGSCTNSYSESKCRAWGQAGECNRNPGWMSKNCSRECCPSCRAPAAPVFQPRVQQPYYGGFSVPNVYGANPYGRASLPYYG